MTHDDRLRVMRNHQISPGARLLWFELSQWVTDDFNVCVRTHRQLAATLGVHRNTVIRWLKELQTLGFVTELPRQRSNAYGVHLEPVALLK
jgi:hypothetical protein